MTPSRSTDVCERVREACAWVAERASAVRIEEEAVGAYAARLSEEAMPPVPDPLGQVVDADREQRVAFVVCLNAINFGSGWWPTIRKLPGKSGFFTIATGLGERFRSEGGWSAEQLSSISAADLASTLGQDPGHPLMADLARSLQDVGAHVVVDHGGGFGALVQAADGSAPDLADLLAGWEAFSDVSTYEGKEVPFFKRAQLMPADLCRAGLASLSDLDRLTAFADNLVPHVLRLDGVLSLDPELTAAIDAEELLVHGSSEEVELRACAVHAIELLAAATERRLAPAEIDGILWNRGAQPRYKAVPRPRSRNTAY
jgi:hypothetical protein